MGNAKVVRGVLPNSAIQLSVCVVTPRACARVAPTQPAPDRGRYTDTGKDPNGERPCLKHPNGLSSPSLPTWVGSGWLRSSRVKQPRLCSAGGTRGRFSCAPAGRLPGTLGVRSVVSNRRAFARGRIGLWLGAPKRRSVGAAGKRLGNSDAESLVRGFRITTRCSGRTRASRPVQSTGRAARRAAERER